MGIRQMSKAKHASKSQSTFDLRKYPNVNNYQYVYCVASPIDLDSTHSPGSLHDFTPKIHGATAQNR